MLDDARRDRRLIYAAAFLRALSTGMVGVLIGVHLAERGFEAAEIGRVVSAGLWGAALAALAVTLFGDRVGRRRALFGVSSLAAAGGVVLSLVDGFSPVAGAAFFGMVNGMGRDRGAAVILDQAVLPNTTNDAQRTKVFSYYNVAQDAGHALGALFAGTPLFIERAFGIEVVAAGRAALLGYAGLLALSALFYLRLSAVVEPARERPRFRLSPAGRRVLPRISALFALDSLAGGFLTAALLSVFFFQRFGVSELTLGLLFFGARVANAGSHLGAAWLARRIGLVNTMVFTHIPSSLLLATVAIAPSFPVAAALFLLREGLVEMDVPTRQSYVMAVVAPGDRTFASGVTHLVRVAAWAVAPAVAGEFMQGSLLGLPLFIGAGMKIVYDLLLYTAFHRTKPPEEGGVAR